jgi:hypothetical protein
VATLVTAGSRTSERATLYARLGGAPAITAAVVSVFLLCNRHEQPQQPKKMKQVA